MAIRNYYVYIMASISRVIYVGVTNNIERRCAEHKSGCIEGFTKTYHCTKLVWYEWFRDIRQAIACEKRIKGWARRKKVALIEAMNPRWCDLSREFTPPEDSSLRSE
jgi:putative endonuclease